MLVLATLRTRAARIESRLISLAMSEKSPSEDSVAAMTSATTPGNSRAPERWSRRSMVCSRVERAGP